MSTNIAPSFYMPRLATGKVSFDVNGSDLGYALAVQSDGKILLAGNSGGNYCLVRLNTDGTLDTSFDGDGKATFDISGWDHVKAISLQSDGKIIVSGYSNGSSVGTSYSTSGDYSVVRLNADGTLDASFDGDGKAIINVGTYADESFSLAIQTDGKLVLAGRSFMVNAGNPDYSLIRLNADGSLDQSFDGDGKAFFGFGGYDMALSVLIQPDEKMVLCGYTWISNGEYSALRLNADGSLDTSFGTGGKSIIDVQNSDYSSSALLQTDGKIVMVGVSSDSGINSKFSLVRLNTDGSLDSSFSGDGRLVIDLEGGEESIANITQQSDGKILLIGNSFTSSNSDYAIVRLNTDGSLDTSFSSDGKVVIDINGKDYADDVRIQADGKIVVSGTSNDNFSIIRLNPDGTLDTTFGETVTPGSATLAGTVTYTEGAAAISLGNNIAITDPELSTLNSSLGNYGGARLTLSRQGSASAQDVFSAVSGSGLSVLTQGNYFAIDGTTTGRVTNNNAGTLTLTFSNGTTQAQINKVLSSLAYQNTSDGPPAQVVLQWQFSDGNTGSQGDGGALTAVGTTTVNITAVNDGPPVLATPLADRTVSPGASFSLTLPATSFTDPDGEALSFSIKGASGSVLPPWLVFDSATRTFSGTADALDEGMSFDIQVTATEAAGGFATDTFKLTVTSPNQLPTGNVTISGNPNVGQPLSASHTLADADGLGTVSYQWLRGGVAIAGATTSSYTLTSADLNQSISVRASYTDGAGHAEAVTSAATVVGLEPGIVFSNAAVGQLVTTEAGGTDSLGVALAALPWHDVLVTLTLSDATEAVFAANGTATLTLTFTADNWANVQSVLLKGVNDKERDGHISFTISTKTSSEDLRYDGARADTGLTVPTLTVTNQDNDTPVIVYGDKSGSATDDRLYGGDGDGADELNGLLGRDELHGKAGNDRLYGGYGDDALHGEDDHDELEGDQGNDKLHGGLGNDTLTGGTGKDTLYGGDGNDVLDGSSDADNMDGGNGSDTYYVDNAADVVSDSGTDGGIDTLYIMAYISGGITLGAGIDKGVLNSSAGDAKLSGNSGNNTLDGNSGNNSLSGGAGNDVLYAASGNDTVDAGDGNDMIVGGDGAGNDRYIGGAGSDTIKYSSATASITVNLTTGTASGSNIGSDTLASIEHLIGGQNADRITGSSSANKIDAGNGNDTIDGGAGNDTLIGGSGSDTASYASASAAVTVNLSSTTAQNTLGAGSDTLSAIESLIGSKYHDKLSGSSGANKLDGAAGNDSLSGGSGNDTLVGGAGRDSLTGGAGNDLFDFNALSELGLGATARDVITDFVAGQDKIDLSTIDANSALAGDQAFKFVTSFTATAGQVRYAGGILYLNTDNDTAAEFEIQLTGSIPTSLTGANLVL